MEELALKLENVKKKYRLGVIGGGSLQADLQSWWARVRGKEDPNSKIGESVDTKKGSFMALKGISFEVKKGERLGIIGGNGAGKSTTLKILSRVTAPTDGTVYINGRISSMLEVGTGFHPELTGRENIYLNGAILGMTKSEIDSKMNDIIEFSECGKFIDTPVKRYSSGMYVKLAFSVAAHLDSEILIMDEVLAVGDMKFQQKCLNKMKEVSENEGRTVLYVSHNMNTIRQLCDRCIVLDKGTVAFDGDVEDAICVYLGTDLQNSTNIIKVIPEMRDIHCVNPEVVIDKIKFENELSSYVIGNKMGFSINIINKKNENMNIYLRILIKTPSGNSVSMSATENAISIKSMEKVSKSYNLNINNLIPGKYSLSFVLYEVDSNGSDRNIDVIRDIYTFSVKGKIGFNHNMPWNPQWWGYITIGDLEENENKEMI